MAGYDLKQPKNISRNTLHRAEEGSRKVRKVFKKSLDVKDDKLFIMGDTGLKNRRSAPTLAYSYYLASKDLGLDSDILFQSPRGRESEASPEIIRGMRNLPKRSSIMQCVSNRLGKINGLGKSFRKYCNSRGHRFTSASSLGGVGPKDFNTLLEAHNYNYKAMRRKQKRLKKRLDSAKEAHITTPAGTDVITNIENSKAVYNHGIYDEYGKGGNLPAGEIYIPINRRSAYGKLVIDGSSRQKDETVLCKNPINIEFKNGIAEKITGGEEARSLKRCYSWAEKKAKHPWGIRMASELGIGLNEKSKVLGATILDEKTKGTAHIATGSNYWFGGDIKAIIHLDQVFHNPTIKLDGRKLNI